MTSHISVTELKKEINKYKKQHCPTVTGKTKTQLVTIAHSLGIHTEKVKVKGTKGMSRHHMLRQISNSTGAPIEEIRKKLSKESLKRIKEIYVNSI